MQFACLGSDLVIHRGRNREKVRVEFARQTLNGFHLVRNRASTVPYHDMFCYHTNGEMDYLAAIGGIPSASI